MAGGGGGPAPPPRPEGLEYLMAGRVTSEKLEARLIGRYAR